MIRHILPDAIHSLKSILQAIQELNSLMCVRFTSHGVDFDTSDSFGVVLFRANIFAAHVNNQKIIEDDYIDKTVVKFSIPKDFLTTLTTYESKGGILIQIQEKTRNCVFYEYLSKEELLTFSFAKDYCNFLHGSSLEDCGNLHLINSITTKDCEELQDDNNYYSISYSLRELLNTLINLNVFSGRSTISLTVDGLLSLHSRFELGSIKFEKEVKNFTSIEKVKKRKKMKLQEELLFEGEFIVKFAAGVLNTLCHNLSKKKTCFLQLYKKKKNVRIVCELCTQSRFCFVLNQTQF